MAQWVKDPMLSLLWRGFDPWLRYVHMPWMQPKIKYNERHDFSRCPSVLLFPHQQSRLQPGHGWTTQGKAKDRADAGSMEKQRNFKQKVWATTGHSLICLQRLT